VGWEHKYKTGSKSMLEWGTVSQTGIPADYMPFGPAAITKKIFPAYKDINENVDIIRVDVEHDIKNVHLGNEFRWEHYSNTTSRLDDSTRAYNPQGGLIPPQKDVSAREQFDHNAVFNTVHAESHLNDWLYVSTGYLFSSLEGGAGINLTTIPFSTLAGSTDKDWFTDGVHLDEKSHVVDVNLMVGPFKSLTGYGGIEAESTRMDGFGNGVIVEGPRALPYIKGAGLFASESEMESENHKDRFQGTAGLRFTGIPFTSLYAEGKWETQEILLDELNLIDEGFKEASAFLRRTDTDVSRQWYTVGFSSSPIKRVSVSGQYRFGLRVNDYDQREDIEGSAAGPISGFGSYPAFILRQEFDTNEFTGRMTYRPVSRLSLSFKYQGIATDIHTRTESWRPLTPGFGGGGLLSAQNLSNIYSSSATWTPTSRLYLTGQVSYRDTMTHAFDNHANSITTYEGDVVSILAAAGYAIDDKTDLKAQYIASISSPGNFEPSVEYSRTRSGYINPTDFGLAYGLDYQQHGITVGVSRRVNKNMEVGLNYGFFLYDEASNNHIDDYTAHLLGGYMKLKF
jgi:hypothetical protein